MVLNTVLDVIFRYGVRCGVGRDVSSLWRLVFKLRGVWGTVGFSDFIVLNIVLALVLCLLGWCDVESYWAVCCWVFKPNT